MARTVEDLEQEVMQLRKQVFNYAQMYQLVRAAVKDQRNLSPSVYTGSYIAGAQRAVNAIEEILDTPFS